MWRQQHSQTEKSYFELHVLFQEIIFLSCYSYFVLLLSFLRGKFCCSAVARNRWRSHQGQLTNELVRIPDVDSGYPKSVYPTAWEDIFFHLLCVGISSRLHGAYPLKIVDVRIHGFSWHLVFHGGELFMKDMSDVRMAKLYPSLWKALRLAMVFLTRTNSRWNLAFLGLLAINFPTESYASIESIVVIKTKQCNV